jgi:poly(3-hydroxybutyrate) depolymerase
MMWTAAWSGRLAGAIVCYALTTCAAAQADEVSKITWDNAFVKLPRTTKYHKMNDPIVQEWMANRKNPVPVYLFLHGSEGTSGPKTTINAPAKEGFIVIVPDSFARPLRSVNVTREIYRVRHGELQYALDQVHQAKWADKNRIIVHGQSEGAWTLASYTGGRYNAALLTGFSCQYEVRDISIPESVYVLNLTFARDKNYARVNAFGTCTEPLAKRGNGKVVIYEGYEHNALNHDEAQIELKQLLDTIKAAPVSKPKATKAKTPKKGSASE